MKTMLYKANGDVKIWGMNLQIITVNDDEIESHLKDGWCKNPNDTKKKTEDKPATKKKAVKDADHNEG
ncbi:hypothetical protein FNU75_02265 [Proteus mirabilis]|uniref:hypothetical protein n=1 Tax=Proteus mirabilis TaxID=584 RepID=UPI0007A6389F|nr:hypothetical protein [Proteus mirabilis]TRY10023.1 hypothetical protein FNU75_02265 [Proteus mirabilis]HCR4046914.1 hypothetical protein [Proteus mirabilis]HCT5875992.1 hypothetical protein [Proteus mirabilis]HEH1607414.1 hypothetical protein [Proteus mirabilis]HEJ0310277.1 hypothetical protein [Proteus mirabilis]